MHLPYILKFPIVLIAVALMDMCWTKFFIYVGKKNELKAGMWASFITMCSMVSTINYVADRRLMPAVFIGAFIGTYVTVKLSK